MKNIYLSIGFSGMLLLLGVQLSAQVAINTDGSAPDSSAMLDVQNTSKGFLPPRLTSLQRDAIPSPSPGLIIFCTDCGMNGVLQIRLNNGWADLTFCSPPSPPPPVQGTHATLNSQVTWKWYPVPGATGYKWNTLNDYTSATDVGSDTTKTETGLTGGATYSRFVWSYNSCGSSSATQLNQFLPFYIGQGYGGGIIFYVDGTGLHGLIAAPSDQSSSAEWGCVATSIYGTGIAIGTGQANTTAIVNGCGEAGIAARICNDLVLNGYDDWFLPSKNELYQMYLHRSAIGGFTNDFYWTSSEYDEYQAWIQYFVTGLQNWYYKALPYYVRAARAF